MFKPRRFGHSKGVPNSLIGASIIEVIIANSLLFGLLIVALFPVTISSGNTSELFVKPQLLPNKISNNSGGVKKKGTPPPAVAGFKINLSGARAYVSTAESGLNDDEAWVIPVSLNDYEQSPCRNEATLKAEILCYLKAYPASIASFTKPVAEAQAPIAVDHFRLDTLSQMWDNLGSYTDAMPSGQFSNWTLIDSNGNALAASTLLDVTTGKIKTVRESDSHRRISITSRIMVTFNNGGKAQAVYQVMRG